MPEGRINTSGYIMVEQWKPCNTEDKLLKMYTGPKEYIVSSHALTDSA